MHGIPIMGFEQARKALKALKGLVKLQALVRGYLVRKQATATLRGMEALIRAQATIRAQKSLGFHKNCYNFVNFRAHCPARKSIVSPIFVYFLNLKF